MKTLPGTYENILHVCERLRLQDRLEVFATRWDDDEGQLAYQLHGTTGDGFLWCLGTDDGEPAFLVGSYEVWPGFWAPWAMGTTRTNEIIKAATKLVLKEMIPGMIDRGFRRAECRVAIKNTLACEWLEHLGGLRESVSQRMGRHGEDFATYVFYPENCHELHTSL